MGVYVQGAKMPQGCKSCWIPKEYCGLERNDDDDQRHVDCPCFEVKTPHGRLIDANEASETMLYEMCGTGYQSQVMSVLDYESHSPTILPEERAATATA